MSTLRERKRGNKAEIIIIVVIEVIMAKMGSEVWDRISAIKMMSRRIEQWIEI